MQNDKKVLRSGTVAGLFSTADGGNGLADGAQNMPSSASSTVLLLPLLVLVLLLLLVLVLLLLLLSSSRSSADKTGENDVRKKWASWLAASKSLVAYHSHERPSEKTW